MQENSAFSTRLSQPIAIEIERQILNGSLKAGDKLPSERELALQMGVSRPSLREALQKLAAKGLLETRHGSGTVVTHQLETSFSDPWRSLLEGHPFLQSDMLEFRHLLEGEAALLACDRATDEDLRRIDKAYYALDAAYDEGDLAHCALADVAFHQTISEASHNVMLGHIFASLMRVIQEHVSSNLVHLHARPEQWDEIRAQHRKIWESIRERRVDDAKTAAHMHVAFVRKSMDAAARLTTRRGLLNKR